jgi:hypothetical protein
VDDTVKRYVDQYGVTWQTRDAVLHPRMTRYLHGKVACRDSPFAVERATLLELSHGSRALATNNDNWLEI